MPTVMMRKKDGTYETIHNRGVLQTEEYREWEIRVHWGGIEGRKFLQGVSLTSVDPRRKDIVSRIKDANTKSLRDENRREKTGTWIYTTCEPFIYGNRPFNLAMVSRVKKAIDAWEENAQKKYGVK